MSSSHGDILMTTYSSWAQVMEQAGSSQQGLGPTPEARMASSCIVRC